MSRVLQNRLDRLERQLGLAGHEGEDELDDPATEARGRAALIALKETWLGGRAMTVDELAAMDARLAAEPRFRFSEAAQAHRRTILATRSLGGSEVTALSVRSFNGYLD